MKKICFYLCAWAVFALSLNPLFAQTPLEVEYQHSGLTLDGLDDIEGFNPGFMDYTDDACMSYRVGQTMVIRFLGSQEIFLLSPDDIGDPDYDLNQYKFGGFHDVAGDAEKELILLPKINNDGPIYCCNLGNNNHFTPKWVVNDGKTHRKIYIQNLDGDLKAEIIVMIGNPIGLGGTVTIGIYGEGFTPGLTDGDPTAHSDKGETCMLESFETQKTFPPHFRWPENRSFLPPGSRDLDGDGKNDFIHILEEEGIFYVVSGRTHEVLYTSGILQDILISSYVRAAFIDFCGTGQKQILLCASNTSAELRDMEIILIIDTSTGELNWAYQPYLDSGYRLRSFKFTLENTMVSIMSHQNSGRVIAVGPGDGFQGGGGANLGGEAPPSDDSQEYTLFMVWESVNTANTFIPDKKDFTVSDLDANGDNVADEPVRVTQDSTSDITAGFYVYDGITGDAIWQTPVQPGVPVDPAPYFHGFFDANGDGEKELLYGAETVLTDDGVIHKPFSAGFAMEYIYDLNDDGFEEIVGKTPEGKIQIWSSSPVSATFEAQLNALGEIAVAPNPSSGAFSLAWDQRKTGQVSFELFDERGAKVMHTSFGLFAAGEARHSIQLGESLPNGLYLGRLCSEGGYSPVFLALQR